MHRSYLLFATIAWPMFVYACSDYTGQNLLKTLPDGRTPVPVFEAGAPMAFDASFEAESDALAEGQAPDASADAPAEAPADTGVDAGVDAGDSGHDGSADGPREGAKG